MNSRRSITILRWITAFAVLAGIVLVYSRWLHVNQTTVALTFLMLILALAANWSLRYAVATALAATVAYNFFFLPPLGHITIADTQNWIALFAFLVTAVVGSRLSQRARDEAFEAKARQKEVELSFQIGRELLQLEDVSNLVSSLPMLLARVTGASAVVLYLLDGDKLLQHGTTSGAYEIPHLRQVALTLQEPEQMTPGEAQLPIKVGVRPRGLLTMRGVLLSRASLHTLGDLVSISLDRAQALEDVARNEANKEGERLRTLIIDSITHELRTPLTSIKGAASALRADHNMAVNLRNDLVDIVDEESDRLNLLVERATEMARLDSQQVHMSFESLDVLPLLQEAGQSCGHNYPEHAISIQSSTTGKILGDRELILKVVCNLVENAAKYSAPGSPIFLSAQLQGADVSVSVADRGMGIDSAEQGLIFDRFYRGRNPNSYVAGTGMGLAISKAIVEAHGGAISVTSQPGSGSVFTFTLPTVR